MIATGVGLVAGGLTTAAWLPQIARVWRLRRAGEISWGYLSIFGTGIACWLAYGIARSDLAITVANALTFFLVASLCLLKFLTRRSESDAGSESQ